MGTAKPAGDDAELLNRGCICITLDRHALIEALNQEVGSRDFAQRLSESHPSLFSNVPAFVPAETLSEMARVTARLAQAIESELRHQTIEVDGLRLEVFTQDLPDRGSGSMESKVGADPGLFNALYRSS
jgi:hypothetical protein